MSQKHILRFFLLGGVLTLAFFVLNLSLGSVGIPLGETLSILGGAESSNSSWEYIVLNYRLPKALTALMVGSGLAIAGLMMQTLFRNPLAGPFVLGISSGASLGVALLVLGAGIFGGSLATMAFKSWGIVAAASLGSFLVLLAVLTVTTRIKDTMAILIIGLMFGSLTAAVVAVMAFFSPAEDLQRYVFWSFGSLGGNSWGSVGVLGLCFAIGIVMSLFNIKALNALLLGPDYAQSIGVQLKRATLWIILATCILAGAITAFAGPIAFIGLAVPHLTRLFLNTSDHRVLVPAVALTGGILMLICDVIAQLPYSEFTLPINAVTSLFGAPVVIWLLVRKRKLLF
ncbi:FecCD family ABC transporter permease [Gilvibacter sediminis]|uniref:FecCD family ABC transporter permease n=1 Tax=Gilvibacter sediminis TaxID=379071 RepID=UPI0023504CF0|nr:iron ABC transporter permease [Gilvibacter sediminis]MDC7999056.1 iron ABC transporter permease [Gilvibacter sediminis]